jgi:hypothetical protein
MRREAALFGLIGLLGLIGFWPPRFLGARGHPGVVFGRATARRHAGRLAAHPMRHIRQPLARGLPRARRQQAAGKAEEGQFEIRGRTIHGGVMPTHCGDRDAQSRPRCDGEASRSFTILASVDFRSWLRQVLTFLRVIAIKSSTMQADIRSRRALFRFRDYCRRSEISDASPKLQTM